MLRILLAAAALATIVTIGPRPAAAYGTAPWCAVFDTGWQNVVWDCRFRTLEACVPWILTGNRGFCDQNPALQDKVKPQRRGRSRHSPPQ